jgi:nitrous oxidase accessory protein
MMGIAAAVSACSGGGGGGQEPITPSPPSPPPPACRVVRGDLQQAIDDAATGDTLCLAPGRYPGPIALGRGVTLWGPPEAVITSRGTGTTVRLGAGACLTGLTVDGSGGRFDLSDAAVHLSGEAPAVRGVTIRNATFGVVVEKARAALVQGNTIVGAGSGPFGMRGDAIRLWEVRGATVTDNRVFGSRDMVIWYASGNQIARNEVRGSRYGVHLMYSHRNRVLDNVFADNVVGVFVMYSREVELRNNLISGSRGNAGVGVGIKESGSLRVEGNRLAGNTTAIYLDTTPLQLTDDNVFRSNVLAYNEVAVLFHKSETRNTFEDNVFRGNLTGVEVDGGGHARDVTWRRNDFDDYAGYDLDRDGFGDLPYQLRSLSSDLRGRAPALTFLRGAPALFLVELFSQVIPLFAPRVVLIDPQPRMRS